MQFGGYFAKLNCRQIFQPYGICINYPNKAVPYLHIKCNIQVQCDLFMYIYVHTFSKWWWMSQLSKLGFHLKRIEIPSISNSFQYPSICNKRASSLTLLGPVLIKNCQSYVYSACGRCGLNHLLNPSTISRLL